MTTFFDSHYKEVKLSEGREVKWRISAYALVRSNNKILMVRSVDSGLWELPGGKVEIDETLVGAVVREVMEETQQEIKVPSNIPLFVGEGGWYMNKRDTFFHIVYFIFEGELVSRSNSEAIFYTAPQENDQVAWIDIATLTKENCHPNFYRYFETLK